MTKQNPGLSPSSEPKLFTTAQGDSFAPNAWWESFGGGLLLHLWSLLNGVLFFVLRLLAPFFPKAQRLLSGRQLDPALLRQWAAQVSPGQARYLVFCSSAGEYEQALPLIERWRERDQAQVLVVFFSPSGVRFLKARGETTPYILAPPDCFGLWRRVMQAYQPTTAVVVRHELWPVFLVTMRRGRCPLYLINASHPPGERRYRGLRLLRERCLLAFFDAIYTVSTADAAYFASVLAGGVRVQASGDTKYDRVVERAVRQAQAASHLRSLLAAKALAASRLVVGSAWPADAELCCRALVSLRQQGNAAAMVQHQAVIVLHEPHSAAVAEVEGLCRSLGLASCRWSALQGAASGSPPDVASERWDVLIVDRLGILAELYATADLAFVGGALHHQVHNVLEPASYGLALAYGPLYKNSGEAIRLVEEGLARVVTSADELASWWQAEHQAPQAARSAMSAFLQQACGAADAIYKELATRGA